MRLRLRLLVIFLSLGGFWFVFNFHFVFFSFRGFVLCVSLPSDKNDTRLRCAVTGQRHRHSLDVVQIRWHW